MVGESIVSLDEFFPSTLARRCLCMVGLRVAAWPLVAGR